MWCMRGGSARELSERRRDIRGLPEVQRGGAQPGERHRPERSDGNATGQGCSQARVPTLRPPAQGDLRHRTHGVGFVRIVELVQLVWFVVISFVECFFIRQLGRRQFGGRGRQHELVDAGNRRPAGKSWTHLDACALHRCKRRAFTIGLAMNNEHQVGMP